MNDYVGNFNSMFYRCYNKILTFKKKRLMKQKIYWKLYRRGLFEKIRYINIRY